MARQRDCLPNCSFSDPKVDFDLRITEYTFFVSRLDDSFKDETIIILDGREIKKCDADIVMLLTKFENFLRGKK